MIPYNTRKAIVDRHRSGEKLNSLAKELGYSYSGVRKIWRLYREEGTKGLYPKYANCGKPSRDRTDLVYRSACWLKHLHRKWGADFIKQVLERRHPQLVVPHERTLQRWFHSKGYNKIIYRRLPPRPATRAAEVHDTWQVDAKEQFTLSTGDPSCYLNLTDEYSGGFISLQHFPPQPY